MHEPFLHRTAVPDADVAVMHALHRDYEARSTVDRLEKKISARRTLKTAQNRVVPRCGFGWM
jgi:hypothetical protein